jgi:transposase
LALQGSAKESMHVVGYVTALALSTLFRRHVMETKIILAIDLGRYKSVLCWYDPDTRAAEFSTVTTTPDDIQRAIVRSPVSVVVFEACTQAGWVHDLCEATGLPTMVASTAGEAWQWKRVKRKTDRDDALKIARMAAINEIDPVAIPDRVTRQWKSLIGMRKRLVSERVRIQNRIRGLLVCQGLSTPRGFSAWSAAGMNSLSALSLPLPECPPDQLWRGELALLVERYRFLEGHIDVAETRLDSIAKADPRVRLLLSMPGVGPRTAEVIVAHLPDAKRFRSADEVSAYAGLVPRQYQSGGERPPQPLLTAQIASRVELIHPVSKESGHGEAGRSAEVGGVAAAAAAI